MMTMDDPMVQFVADLEIYISKFAKLPCSINLYSKDSDKLSIPYTVESIWYDDHDGRPTLGITYVEFSVKNGREMQIFKPVRANMPIGIIEVWIKNLPQLLEKLLAQKKRKSVNLQEECNKITEMLRSNE